MMNRQALSPPDVQNVVQPIYGMTIFITDVIGVTPF